MGVDGIFSTGNEMEGGRLLEPLFCKTSELFSFKVMFNILKWI